MNPIHRIPKIFSLVATAMLLTLAAAPTFADEADKELEEIIVQAPISVERKELNSISDPIVKTELIELSRQVYIGDLDLSQYADVKELESRIELIAKDSCAKLAQMFPLNSSRSKDARRCVDLAIKSALAEKEAAIAAAQ